MEKLSHYTVEMFHSEPYENAYPKKQYIHYRKDTQVAVSAEERALVRKIDLLVMPLVCMVGGIQFLNRSAIDYAMDTGFKDDSHLDPSQCHILGAIFCLGYLLFQQPNGLLLQRVSVGRCMGILVFFYGTVLACTAASRSFLQRALVRFFLGAFEAGIYPSIMLVICTFYRRSEHAARFGAFGMSVGIAMVFGDLVSFGISSMPNPYGMARWQWMMVILGAITACFGLVLFFFLIDNPKSPALRLNAEQEILAEERTRDNAVVRTTTIKFDQILEALKEPRLWWFCVACLLMNLQNGAMAICKAQIVEGYGFTDTKSILPTVGAAGSIVMFISIGVWITGKTNQIIYTACGFMVVDTIGLAMLMVPNQHIKLIGFCLAWSIYAANVLLATSIANNVTGYTKKILYHGLLATFFMMGDFAGPFMMSSQGDVPFIGGMIGYICATIVAMMLLLAARIQMVTVNNRRLSSSSALFTNVEDDHSDAQDTNLIYRL